MWGLSTVRVLSKAWPAEGPVRHDVDGHQHAPKVWPRHQRQASVRPQPLNLIEQCLARQVKRYIVCPVVLHVVVLVKAFVNSANFHPSGIVPRYGGTRLISGSVKSGKLKPTLLLKTETVFMVTPLLVLCKSGFRHVARRPI